MVVKRKPAFTTDSRDWQCAQWGKTGVVMARSSEPILFMALTKYSQKKSRNFKTKNF
jgi:hypothetical protein